MARSSSNGIGPGNISRPAIHLVLQGEGRVAKSLVASWLAKFPIECGEAVRSTIGRRVCIDIPISAGEMLTDALLGLQTLAAGATERTLVARIHEYLGPVGEEGRAFSQMLVSLQNHDKVAASVGRERSGGKFAKSIELARVNKLTSGESIGSREFGLMDRNGLGMVRAELFDRLAQTPFA